MRPRKLLWQLFPYFLLTLAAAIGAVLLQASATWRHFHEDTVAADLLARARLLSEETPGGGLDGTPAEIDARMKDLGRRAQTRFTVMKPDGTVVADSDHETATMDNHALRPEMAEALRGQVGRSTRYSDTLHRRMMYVAVPIVTDGKVQAVIRASVPLTGIDAALRAEQKSLLLAGLATLVLAAGVSFALSRRIARPLEEIRRAAERFARGDLAARAPVPISAEMGQLARAFNQMAADLDARMHTILQQRNEEEAVLSSMTEGVVAVDRHECILNLNQAAAHFLEVDPAQARGRPLPEIVRNPDLQQMVAGVLQRAAPAEGEFVLYGGADRVLRAQVSLLQDPAGQTIGALLVLDDVTRLKKLENMRRDFVANASHELKTPITALKGYIETLADGAGDDPESSRRFLGIMSRQVDRLEAIVEDLLRLSRLEHEGEPGRTALAPTAVRPLLENVIQTCAAAAAEKRIAVTLECPEDLRAILNATLLEQAVMNLVDNAIKYSEAETRVVVSAHATDLEVEIRVADQGCGIEKKHLPRIFERFYRVDAARSRSLGGTGLGLAIVKHIVLAQRGRVAVDSTPGVGSTFSLFLPRAA